MDVMTFDGVSFDGVSRRRAQRPRLVAALLGAVALVAAACSGGAGAGASTAASAAAAASGTVYEVKAVTDAKLGTYLVGEDGKTLYVFLKDAKDTSNCSGQCATNWPPFTLDSGESVKAGDGVTGTFGQITRADGKVQVTYDGAPLYYFAKDTKAGDTNGQGLNNVWYVASVAGGPGGVAASAAPASAAASGKPGSSTAVSIIDFGFQPNAITVDVGATVTWTNTGSAPHTVTADDGSFGSGTLSNGGTFSFTFAKAGTYTFHCKIHPNMTGTVTVQASAY